MDNGILGYLPQFKQSWKLILVLVAIVLLIMAIYYVWKNYVSPKLNPTYVANKEFNNGDDLDSKTAEMRMFVVDWCPHCKTAAPIWNEMIEEYNGKIIGGYKVNFETVDCTKEDDLEVKQIQSQFNIDSYPTIKLVKDNQIIEYDAKPNKETLQQFLQTVLT
tara:strand:- start:1013 stop:1498 length:486 start_codon:yes stop_codon:yes gene_type:complete